MALRHKCFHIRISADRSLFAAPRSFSQLITSFIGSWCQGIRLMLLFAWTFLSVISLKITWFSSFFLNCLSFIKTFFRLFLSLQLKDFPFVHWFFPPFGEIVFFTLLFNRKTYTNLLIFVLFVCSFFYSSIFLSFIRFSMINQVPISFDWLVGTSGLEPPTSRLSGARSNHLSYAPLWLSLAVPLMYLWWRWWESNPWPPACRAGALPAELHPHRFGYHLFF